MALGQLKWLRATHTATHCWLNLALALALGGCGTRFCESLLLKPKWLLAKSPLIKVALGVAYTMAFLEVWRIRVQQSQRWWSWGGVLECTDDGMPVHESWSRQCKTKVKFLPKWTDVNFVQIIFIE